MQNHSYPMYTASGSPANLGRMHGEQAREKICGYLDFLQDTLHLTRSSMRVRAERFRPLFAKFCPHLLDEVVGLAQGAAVHESDALAVQLRGELGGLQDEACTAFAISRSRAALGGTLIGQNSDNPPEFIDFGYVLRLIPENGPRILIWTFGGMIGYHGLNEHGIAHFANALGGGPRWKFALSHYPVKRMILEQSSLDAVRRLLRDVPVCSNGNYVLCDGSGAIADIELTTEGPFEVGYPESKYLVHSNHYLCSAFDCAANQAQSLPDSVERQSRMQFLIESNPGLVTVADVQRYLSDHEKSPTGICRHSHDGSEHPMLSCRGKTVASLIGEPDQGRLHVACGNPCETAFATYRLND